MKRQGGNKSTWENEGIACVTVPLSRTNWNRRGELVRFYPTLYHLRQLVIRSLIQSH